MRGRGVVVVGAGGHAREVMECLLHAWRAGTGPEPLGFIDESPDRTDSMNGLPVLGGLEWLVAPAARDVEVICAIGTPSACRDLVGRVSRYGVPFGTMVSPLAWIAPTASVDEGSMIFPQVVVNANARVGRHVTLNVASTVSHDTVVGDFCGVGPGAHLAGNVWLGEACFIGMSANVIQGVTIGAGSVVGAGAVVLEDVPEGATVVGVPGRLVGPASANPLSKRRPARSD